MALLVIGTAMSVAACGGRSGAGSIEASSPVRPAEVSSPVDGQVIKIDTEGLTRVRGFVLRTDAGAEIPLRMGPLENAVGFPPSHLAEHMATGEPVRVSFRGEGTALVVYRVEDVPEP